MKIAVSFLKSKFDLKTTIKKIDNSSADYIHVDFMDGKFVANKNFTQGEITKLLSDVSKPLDVHLMVENPLKYLDTFAMLNTEFITFHVEMDKKINELIGTIKSMGLKAGISLKPDTDIEKIVPYLKDVKQVLVMTVEPGEGGQEFLISQIEKISRLKTLREENNFDFLISVDGGINEESVSLVNDADMVVSGSYICQSDDFEEKIKLLNMD